MKIYKVNYYENTNSSHGFSYHTSLSEAKKKYNEFKKQYPDCFDGIPEDGVMTGISVIDIEKPNLKTVIKLLNSHANHADNG